MRPLWEKLQTLQCHFTWDLGAKDKVDAAHNLRRLSRQVEHTPYPNRGVYLALRAYLLHLQGHHTVALGALREAEADLEQEHPADFGRQVLVTYGNYAWIYYLLTSYEKVELYLGRIRNICRSLGSPEPYSAAIPEVQAQKGWSLLAVGWRNAEAARRCFQEALEGQESSQEFRAGLATAVYAWWTHTWSDDLRQEARALLEQVLAGQPQNAEAQVYLANILNRVDRRRASHLVDDVFRHSPNPEVLRLAAKVWNQQSVSRAITILEKAIALDPAYALLHHDLGVCYLEMLKTTTEGRADVAAKATESFQRALAANPGHLFSRLKMAQAYGETSQAYEEEVYLTLMEELPGLSKRCQQAIYLHYGDFLLQKKGLEQEALEMYQAGLKVPSDHPSELKHLVGRLKDLARRFREKAEEERAKEVLHFLEAQGHPVTGDEGWVARPRRERMPATTSGPPK